MRLAARSGRRVVELARSAFSAVSEGVPSWGRGAPGIGVGKLKSGGMLRGAWDTT